METPNYYAIIPADVRYDKRLSMLERLLYGEITALSQKTGECWATNAYFAELYEKQPTSISHNISNLAKYGYIEISVDKKEGNRRVISITINRNSYNDKSQDPITINRNTPIAINRNRNNTSINNTSLKEEETPYPLSTDMKETPKPNLFSSPNSAGLKKAPTLNCSGDTPVQIKPPAKEDDDDFMTFFNASPIQSRFQTALETWHQKRIKGRLPPIEKILEALEEQKIYRYTDPKYTPSPAKWLEEEEWRYVIDAKTKSRVNKMLHEKRLDELEEMYRGDATNEEIEAFARKYNLMPDVFPQVGNEEGKNEFE